MRRKYGETTFVWMQGIVVTGIHTEVGKSIVAWALAAGLGWPYWKPVQTGHPKDTDLAQIQGLSVMKAAYEFDFPGAPLIAAQLQGTALSWDTLLAQWNHLPKPFIVEGAGGLFVPLTPERFFIDFFKAIDCPVVLVVRPYLGAINHTWLSLHALAAYHLTLLGIVLCATTGDPSEAYFRDTFADLLIGEIPYYSASLPSPRALYQQHLKDGLEKALRKPLAAFSLQSL